MPHAKHDRAERQTYIPEVPSYKNCPLARLGAAGTRLFRKGIAMVENAIDASTTTRLFSFGFQIAIFSLDLEPMSITSLKFH